MKHQLFETQFIFIVCPHIKHKSFELRSYVVCAECGMSVIIRKRKSKLKLCHVDSFCSVSFGFARSCVSLKQYNYYWVMLVIHVKWSTNEWMNEINHIQAIKQYWTIKLPIFNNDTIWLNTFNALRTQNWLFARLLLAVGWCGKRKVFFLLICAHNDISPLKWHWQNWTVNRIYPLQNKKQKIIGNRSRDTNWQTVQIKFEINANSNGIDGKWKISK